MVVKTLYQTRLQIFTWILAMYVCDCLYQAKGNEVQWKSVYFKLTTIYIYTTFVAVRTFHDEAILISCISATKLTCLL